VELAYPRAGVLMPIRPENRARYPKDWPAISKRIRLERAGNRCEQCGVPNYELGGRTPDGKWHKAHPTGECTLGLTWPAVGSYWWCGSAHEHLRIVKIVLTVAHLDHTPENCTDENLRAWCQRCHNLYDAAMRRQGIRERAFADQLKMFEDLA
jgi:hypothetical protein